MLRGLARRWRECGASGARRGRRNAPHEVSLRLRAGQAERRGERAAQAGGGLLRRLRAAGAAQEHAQRAQQASPGPLAENASKKRALAAAQQARRRARHGRAQRQHRQQQDGRPERQSRQSKRAEVDFSCEPGETRRELLQQRRPPVPLARHRASTVRHSPPAGRPAGPGERSRRPICQNFQVGTFRDTMSWRIAMTHHRHLYTAATPAHHAAPPGRAGVGGRACTHTRTCTHMQARHLARAAHGGPLSSSRRHRGPACRCAAGGRRWPPCTCSPAQQERNARVSTAAPRTHATPLRQRVALIMKHAPAGRGSRPAPRRQPSAGRRR
jgi:hypothetical protein